MDENLLQDKIILVVDDETDLRDIVASELDFMGAKVFQAENITVAQKLFKENKIDLIVSDIRMPGGTGIDLLDKLKDQDVEEPPVILITGFADITTEDAFDKGAEALLNKPFRLDDLIQQAVRFTSPRENRFQEKHECAGLIRYTSDKTLSEVMESKDLYFGRGGVSGVFDLQDNRAEVGQTYEFEFQLKDQTLKGTVVCRWNKFIDDKEKLTALGLEFQQLDQAGIAALSKVWQGETKAYIPAIHQK